MQAGHGVLFEDGVETTFSLKLLEAIRSGGNEFIHAVENYVMSGRADDYVAAEAFRWIGAIDDEKTKEARWRLLIMAFQYPSMTLRDGALMGLAAMNDRRALPYLSKGLTVRENEPLRRDIAALINQLQ
jgi:hypothetical protein